ncbi:VWA domain-containing protein [Sorangium sp. So ce375]|uniref:vWA domain-containing protein n=1 Tax=Sorangium sp. So ce375 TaxID=3133306 RepID=UPI003F5C6064
MFNARLDRPLLPAERSERLLRVEITVPRPEGSQARKPVHLSLVIDRSGSMTGEKLRLALEAARQAIRTLQPGDRFSVVTFDHQVEVPIPSTEATPGARLHAEAALDTVIARGNTDLGGGWLRGCAEVGAHLPEDAISFVAYELLLYGLHALSADYEPAKLLHTETLACLFDLCQQKAEVGIKLQAGHLCAGCLGKLSTVGLDRDVVTQLWRAVQALAQSGTSTGR